MPLQSADPERQLFIKVKACQRLTKEVAYYKQEAQENEVKLQAMKDEGIKDEYDLKKFDEVLQESYMMIPDSERRLKESLKDLELFLDTNHDTLNKDNESYLEARTMVQNPSDKEGLVQETHVEDDADVF